jgi:uncharacterized protein
VPGARLTGADSAYLRQHATNPVDWYPWGDEAFAAAAERDIPVFLSVGYAACHWCHVMAHESFENDAIASVLNAHFVAIKVDREERPDVDAYYMTATQAFTGSGGWPMSVFLTADRRPFLAGTYFPPVARHGQPGFPDLLRSVDEAWRTRRGEVEAQATQIAGEVASEVRALDGVAPGRSASSWTTARHALAADLVTRADARGGFSGPPKFPRPSYVEALLPDWHDPATRSIVRTTLDAMSREGLYDHVGGGFARYSVDAEWHVPHFEKMLSDQALLAACYLRADRAAGGGTEWRDVALETLAFVTREMAVPNGFASSLDADTVDGEGAHVTFTVAEVRAALTAAGIVGDTDAVLARWRITDPGEFEGRSIPRLAPGAPFRTPPSLVPALDVLRRARAERPAPGRDGKVVLEWNAMFACAAIESGDATLVTVGLDLATSLMTSHHRGGWWRTSAGSAPATAADLAWLAEAHLTAFEYDGEDRHLDDAGTVIDDLITGYWDGAVPTASQPENGWGFTTSRRDLADMPTAPKEFLYGASPAAWSVAASVLARFTLVTGDERSAAIAARVVDLGASVMAKMLMAVPDLIRALGLVRDGREVVVPGGRNDLSDLVRSAFVPASVLVTGSGRSPLLAARVVGTAYVCRGRVCQLPATTARELAAQLAGLPT